MEKKADCSGESKDLLIAIFLRPGVKGSENSVFGLPNGGGPHIYELVGIPLSFHFILHESDVFEAIQNTIQALRHCRHVSLKRYFGICPRRNPYECSLAISKAAKVLAVRVCS